MPRPEESLRTNCHGWLILSRIEAFSKNTYVDGLRLARWQSRGLIGSLAIICAACCAAAHDRWPRWFSRREFLTLSRPLRASVFFGVSRMLDRSITPTSRFLQVPHQLDTSAVFTLPVAS